MSFYATLQSDSSLRYFPNNKISHFITQLPNPIELHGEWEIALAELLYPHTWNNVNSQNNLIGFDLNDGKKLGRRIPPGFYATIPDILKAISVKDHESKISFDFHPVTKHVHVKVKNGAQVILEEGMAQLLGFDGPTIINSSGSENVETVMSSTYVTDPCANYRVLMIYTDLVQPQIVGDTVAPLLCIVNVRGSDGEIVCEQYERPHYMPLARKRIDTIEVVIRTRTGQLAPFERGRSYVKLHFRQKFLS